MSVTVLTVVGARPQFIKAAVVSRALRLRPDVREVLVHTGQHYDTEMSDVFFDELDIPRPDHHLGVGSGPHGAQTGRMLAGIEEVLLATRPDWTLVYGDTNSTLAGALAAAKLHVPVAHVEAGLRSFNRAMPEELNRVLTDHSADLLFTPTRAASENLTREGIAADRVHQVGDVMYDAALYYGARAEARSGALDRHCLESGGYVLATVHRAENTDRPERLRAILDGLVRVAKVAPVVLPLHPRTRHALETGGVLDHYAASLRLAAPLGYLDMVMLERHAAVIATDSGGVQKEAFFYGVPCVTLRDETEWVETVEAGANELVGADAGRLAAAVGRRLRHRRPLPDPGSLYGDGRAADEIARVLAEGPGAG